MKETIDQGSAFEAMVEDLSDQVMSLEDACVSLQSTIREMEEAAEIAAELEEVQAEEVKALMMDLEGRDSIVRNLEEAIKIVADWTSRKGTAAELFIAFWDKNEELGYGHQD